MIDIYSGKFKLIHSFVAAGMVFRYWSAPVN